MLNFHVAPSSSPSRKQQATALIQAMEECLEQNRHSGANPSALRRMQELASELQAFGGPFGEKPGSIAAWAETLWSPRKHSRWNTVVESGADRVRQFMLHDLVSLRSLNDQMQD